jgi:hypothetical protein
MQLDLGSARAPRAVLRALAEHIGGIALAEPFANRKIGNQRAGAPIGTREGACAPRIELNRSGLIMPKSAQNKRGRGQPHSMTLARLITGH